MNNNRQKFEWQELKKIWVNSDQTRGIHNQMSNLFDEAKEKTIEFEKKSIQKDFEALKVHWVQWKEKASEFEKNSINNDLTAITTWLKKFLS